MPVSYGNVFFFFYYYEQHGLSVYIAIDVSPWVFALVHSCCFYANAFSGVVLWSVCTYFKVYGYKVLVFLHRKNDAMEDCIQI